MEELGRSICFAFRGSKWCARPVTLRNSARRKRQIDESRILPRPTPPASLGLPPFSCWALICLSTI